jgi:hypothetical protein
MRQVGLEIYLTPSHTANFPDQSFQFLHSRQPSIFFCFADRAARDRIYDLLCRQVLFVFRVVFSTVGGSVVRTLTMMCVTAWCRCSE